MCIHVRRAASEVQLTYYVDLIIIVRGWFSRDGVRPCKEGIENNMRSAMWKYTAFRFSATLVRNANYTPSPFAPTLDWWTSSKVFYVIIRNFGL